MRRFVRLNRVSFLLALITLLMLLPALSLTAQPRHKRETREQIFSLEQQWKRAQVSDDISAMDKLLSDDYLGITASGDVLTKTQQLERMRNRTTTVTTLEISDIKIKLVGQIAIVNSFARVQGISDNHRLDGNYRYTHIYQHLPTGLWKITNFEITHIRGSGPVSQPPAP